MIDSKLAYKIVEGMIQYLSEDQLKTLRMVFACEVEARQTENTWQTVLEETGDDVLAIRCILADASKKGFYLSPTQARAVIENYKEIDLPLK